MHIKWILIILSFTSNAFASILVKFAMTPPNKFPSLSEPFSFFLNFPLIIGIFLYISAFFFYSLSLKHFPLNIAHPVITSSAIATVSILSVIFIKESFKIKTFIGLVAVILGVLVLTS